MAEFTGNPVGSGRRFAVVASRFNETVTRALVDGALDALVRHGMAFDDIDVVWVPGAWELPLAVRRAMATERYEAVVALGAVIRGDTPHFDYVAGECAAGIMRVTLDTGIPIVFGVLTVDDLDQALARCGGSVGNKGEESAATAVEMVSLLRQISKDQ
jgi:6,7-dimethyl-8-ribityllumazine synthase